MGHNRGECKALQHNMIGKKKQHNLHAIIELANNANVYGELVRCYSSLEHLVKVTSSSDTG